MDGRPVEGPIRASHTSGTILYPCPKCNHVLLYRQGRLCSGCLQREIEEHEEE